MASEISSGKPERDCASPAPRTSRRRSFSRRSLPQQEQSKNPVEYDRDSSSALVNSIFAVASDALALVSKELNFTQDEVAAVKAKLHSVEETLGSRNGPIEGACRALVALQDGLCPPKRLKTESAEDFYVRTLQQTLNDWDLSSIQSLLSEMTALEPLPAMDEPLDTASSFSTEDKLELQLQKTEQLLAEEASFEKLMRNAMSEQAQPLSDSRGTTARKLMEQFSLYKIVPNKVG